MNYRIKIKIDTKNLFLLCGSLFYYAFISAFRFKINPIISLLITIFFIGIPILIKFMQSKKIFTQISRMQTLIIHFIFVTGVLLYLSYVVEFYKENYAEHGKVAFIIYGFMISGIITILCRVKQIFFRLLITGILTVFITPLLSSINTSYNVREIKTVTLKVTNTKSKYQNYYIYADTANMPEINDRFKCDEDFYEEHQKDSEITLTYRHGLFGLKFVRLDEN